MDASSDKTPDRAAVEELVEALREEGRAEEELGEFTLDREQARQKLTQFRLSEPHSYVLELVQASVLKGASRIDVTVDADDVELQCNGRPFSTRDFADLYRAVFTRAVGDADHQARRELALGLSTSQALDPKWIRVLSFEGDRGAELTIRPGGVERFADRTERPSALRSSMCTQIRLRFPKKRLSVRPEAKILRERCRWAQVSISCNGEVVNDRALPHGVAVSAVGRPPLHVEAGYVVPAGKAQLHLVVNGAHIATHPLKDMPKGFVAVARADQLRKDASSRDVIHDDPYDAVLQAVQSAHAQGRQEHDVPRLIQKATATWINRELESLLQPWVRYWTLIFAAMGMGSLFFILGTVLLMLEAEWPLLLLLLFPVGYWIFHLGSEKIAKGAAKDFDERFPKSTHRRERQLAMTSLEQHSDGYVAKTVRCGLLDELR